MPTTDDCKKMLFKIGITQGVSPKLISTRLLSNDDKNDMVNGQLTYEQLFEAVKVWAQNGMPDYANGKTNPYKEFLGRYSAKQEVTKKRP